MRDMELMRAVIPERSRSHDFPQPAEADASFGDHDHGGMSLLRKASCACGGACPSCAANSSQLSISRPDDPAEIDADRTADRVIGMDNIGHAETQAPLSIQRKHSTDSGPLHVADDIGGRIADSRGGGAALETGTRAFMESRFGRDLGNVRVHTGDYAAEFNHAVGAQAFTLGNDIYFGPGKYDTGSREGRSLIAHELAHTVQQNATSNTLHRKIEVEKPEITLPHFEKYLKKSGKVYTYGDPVRVKDVDIEILTSMLTSPRTFKVVGKTGEEAETSIVRHVQAREGVVKFAKEKKYRFAAGEAGFEMNPKYWTWGGGKFKSKPDVDLDEARADLNKNPQLYAIGCAAATQLTVKGGGKSDSVSDTTSDEHDWVPGESGFIQNPGWSGADNGLQGENIIYLGNQKFWGHFSNEVAVKFYNEWFAIVRNFNRVEPVLTEDRTYPVTGLKTPNP